MKSLREFLEDFLFNHEFGVAPVTVECYYKPAISDFSKFLGRDALVSDLNRESVNRWIISKQEAGCPGSTIRTRRSAILALWRGAWVNDILPGGPDRIRRIRTARKPVQAWERSEMVQLMNYFAKEMRDQKLRGLP